jgi:hypothetical protein
MKSNFFLNKQLNFVLFVGISLCLVFLIFPNININANESPKISVNPTVSMEVDPQRITFSGTVINLEKPDTTIKFEAYVSNSTEPIYSTNIIEKIENWSFNEKFMDGTNMVRFVLTYGGSMEVEEKISFFVTGVHGEFSANTQSCGNCHNTHTAKEPHLRGDIDVENPRKGIKNCKDCHTDSANNNFKSHGTIEMTNSSQNCTICHNPHGSSNGDNPYSLWDYYEYSHDANHSDVGLINSKIVLCESCHENNIVNLSGYSEYLHDPVKTGITYESGSCVTCHENNIVEIKWKNHYRYLTFKDSITATGNALEDSSLCFSCHDGSKENVSNIKQYYINPEASGHSISTLDSSKINFQIPCSDCHTSHGTKNIKGIRNELGHDGTKIFSATSGQWDTIKEKDFCLSCHSSGTRMYGKALQDLYSLPNNDGHDLNSSKSCSSCHGDSGDLTRIAHAPLKGKPTDLQTPAETIDDKTVEDTEVLLETPKNLDTPESELTPPN